MLQYNKATGEKGILSDYILRYLKYKQEASGFPNWCKTPAQQTEYIEKYKVEQGITLDPANIEYNSLKRSNSKLQLNRVYSRDVT
jgi:hypothetical protein